MSTWNSITIEEPGALTIDTLPTALTSDGELWEGYDAIDEREDVPEREVAAGYTIPGRTGNPDGSIIIQGHSKYTADEASAALAELSKHTGRIVHREEWDYDEVGGSVTVYENGAAVPDLGQHTELIPDQLPKLIGDLRRALAVRGYERNTRPRVRDAARALVASWDSRV
ncbi:hypothetical protein [Microbacterium paludicola]|uniref:hypothetical protein n=1 Tax=Microbacterium paludicola TaxID=300019 RepID=UPI0031DA892F